MDEKAKRFIEEASEKGEIHIIAHRRRLRREEYAGSSRSNGSTTASRRTCLSCFWRSMWKTPRSSRRKCWR